MGQVIFTRLLPIVAGVHSARWIQFEQGGSVSFLCVR